MLELGCLEGGFSLIQEKLYKNFNYSFREMKSRLEVEIITQILK
jgi:hypothetical protein